jgi:hypothetical protein
LFLLRSCGGSRFHLFPPGRFVRCIHHDVSRLSRHARFRCERPSISMTRRSPGPET